MLKNTNKSSEAKKKRTVGFYAMVASACGCSAEYVKMVLGKGFGNYKGNNYANRNTPLVLKIREKAQELEQFINPSDH
jgi:hypothetical protein